jgi:hypothetical protein
MTPEEEDRNANVFRDWNGKVLSEETPVIIRKSEYHTVISEFKYEIPPSEILKTFGSIEEFEKAMNADYGKDPELFIKFDDFMIDRDYSGNREDDWISDRKGGYEVEYTIIKKVE